MDTPLIFLKSLDKYTKKYELFVQYSVNYCIAEKFKKVIHNILLGKTAYV